MNINEISMNLDFPAELIAAMGGKESIIAGGSVLRRLLRAPTEGTDIDVFFYGAVGAENLAEVALALIDAGYTMEANISDERYVHARRVMVRGDTRIDLIFSGKWPHMHDVLRGFDISVAQVGYYSNGLVVMSEVAALDLIRRQLRVMDANGWPTTPARVEKYIGTFGLKPL